MMTALLPNGDVLASVVEPAWSFKTRSRGLLGRKSLAPGYALWLKPCMAIHMWGMQFAIDAVYLDRNNQVVKVVSNLKPGGMSWGGWKAHSVLEMAAGSITSPCGIVGTPIEFAEESVTP